MTKNTTRQRGQGTTRRTTTSSTAQQPLLSELLAAVLRHPDTTADIHNALADVLVGLEANASNKHSPEFIKRVLIENDIQADPAPASETTEDADEATEAKRLLLHGDAFITRGGDNPIPRLTQERACELTGFIVEQDDDETAAALCELITGIAYENDFLERDAQAQAAAGVAFSRTFAYDQATDDFTDAACMRVAPQDA